MKRIRFLSAVETPVPIYRDLLPHLAANGATVELLITKGEYRPGREPLAAVLGERGVRVTHVAIPPMPRKVRKAGTYLFYVIGAALRTLFGRSADLNFFLSQPPLFFVWGYILKLVRGQPYCVLIMDLFPQVAVGAGLLRSDSLLTRALMAVSRFALRRADMVVVIGRCMRDILVAEGVRADVLHVIPNWADEKNVFPVAPADNRLRKELGLKESDFVVLYSGNMGQVHYFDDILEVARRLRSIDDLHFVFAGDGSRRAEIERFNAQHGLTNVKLLPFQPSARLAESLSMGDVHFVSLRPGFEGLSVPSKTYGALAAGRPVLYQGSPNGEIARILVDARAGRVVPVGNPDLLEAAVRELHQERAGTRAAGARASALARGPLSRDSCVTQYTELLTA